MNNKKLLVIIFGFIVLIIFSVFFAYALINYTPPAKDNKPAINPNDKNNSSNSGTIPQKENQKLESTTTPPSSLPSFLLYHDLNSTDNVKARDNSKELQELVESYGANAYPNLDQSIDYSKKSILMHFYNKNGTEATGAYCRLSRQKIQQGQAAISKNQAKENVYTVMIDDNGACFFFDLTAGYNYWVDLLTPEQAPTTEPSYSFQIYSDQTSMIELAIILNTNLTNIGKYSVEEQNPTPYIVLKYPPNIKNIELFDFSNKNKCIDSDGLDYFTSSSIKIRNEGGSTSFIYDSCEKAQWNNENKTTRYILNEQVCYNDPDNSDKNFEIVKIKCAKGCVSGACVK